MKKTVKIVGISLGVAVLLFLSLPFFMGDKSANKKQGETTQQATPQIFTSNPLTELVNRIASVFTKKGSVQPSANAAQNINENALVENEELLADSRGAAGSPLTEETPQAGAGEGSGLMFGDYEDEWVLAPQVAPEGTFRGMHEISAKGDAYDNYLRAERAARFTPVAINPQTKRVPDSKLARIFNPIKRFFGFDDPTAAGGWAWTDEEAARLASAQMDEESAKNPRQFKRAGAVDMNTPNTSFGDSAKEDENLDYAEEDAKLERFFSLFTPEDTAEKLARDTAELKYPAPRTPEQQKLYDDEVSRKKAEHMKVVQAKNHEYFVRKMGQEENKKVEAQELFNCSSASSMRTNSSQCGSGNGFGHQHETKLNSNEVAKIQAQNAAKFPKNAPASFAITPILGVAHMPKELLQTIRDDVDGLKGEAEESAAGEDEEDNFSVSANKASQMAIYKHMLESTPCGNNDCYWIANKKQQDGLLQETMEMPGRTTLQGDPLDLYPQIEKDYIKQVTDQLKKEGKPEEEIQQARKFLEANPPAYVLYSRDNINQWVEQNRQYRKDKEFDKMTIAYTATATDGHELWEQTQGRLPLVPGKDGVSVDNTDPKNINGIHRGTAVTEDLQSHISFIEEVMHEIKANSAQENVRVQMAPIAQEIERQGAAERAAFDATHNYGSHNR